MRFAVCRSYVGDVRVQISTSELITRGNDDEEAKKGADGKMLIIRGNDVDRRARISQNNAAGCIGTVGNLRSGVVGKQRRKQRESRATKKGGLSVIY